MPHPAEIERLGLVRLLDDLDHLGMLGYRLHERHRRVVAQQMAEPGLFSWRQGLTRHHQHLVVHQR